MASICEHMIYIKFGWMCVTQVMFMSYAKGLTHFTEFLFLGKIRQMAKFLQSSKIWLLMDF
jgi:hypothetical protein